jgi:hypothetical protein
VLATCNLVILGNVLDRRTYRERREDLDLEADVEFTIEYFAFDRNAIDHLERQDICISRGMALNMLRWLDRNFEVRDSPNGEPLDFLLDVAYAFLSHQLHTLIEYKRLAEKDQIEGFRGCSLKELKRQVDAIIGVDPSLSWMYHHMDRLGNANKMMLSLDWPARPHMSISRRNVERVDHQGLEGDRSRITDFREAGMTSLDKLFFDGHYKNFALVKHAAMLVNETIAIDDSDSITELNKDNMATKRKFSSLAIDDSDESMESDNLNEDDIGDKLPSMKRIRKR